MNPTITLKEAAAQLNYKDIRSVEKWCEKNSVEIFCEDSSHKRFLVRMQFEYARLKKFILYLQARHQEKWLDAFKVYMSMNITHVVEMEEAGNINSIFKNDKYQTKGENEKEFLASLVRLTLNNHEL